MGGIRVRLAMAGMLGALALGATPASVAVASSDLQSCRVRNVTQETVDTSFATLVAAAVDGDLLRVRGRCRTSGVVIRQGLVISGEGGTPTLDADGVGRVLRIQESAVVVLAGLAITGVIWEGGRTRAEVVSATGAPSP